MWPFQLQIDLFVLNMVHQFPGRFQGKVVAITGGASGVGAALTRRYVAEGAKVLIADMCETEKGQSFVQELPEGSVHFHQCDISDADQATSVVTAAIEKFGDLDIVHNNASAFAWGAIPDMDPEHWARVFKVGVDGPFHICRAAITHMRKQTTKKQRGAIVNTLSTSGLSGDKGLGCYCAAKAALANLTRAMGADHALEGIRVNGVAPGWINTPMSASLSATPAVRELVASSTPMHRPAEPEEIAAVATFLASEDASFVTGAGEHPLSCKRRAVVWLTSILSVECRWWPIGLEPNAIVGRSAPGKPMLGGHSTIDYLTSFPN